MKRGRQRHGTGIELGATLTTFSALASSRALDLSLDAIVAEATQRTTSNALSKVIDACVNTIPRHIHLFYYMSPACGIPVSNCWDDNSRGTLLDVVGIAVLSHSSATRRLRGVLLALPACDVDASTHLTNMPGLPLLRLSGDAAKLHFRPPVAISVAGGFLTQTATKVRCWQRSAGFVCFSTFYSFSHHVSLRRRMRWWTS